MNPKGSRKQARVNPGAQETGQNPGVIELPEPRFQREGTVFRALQKRRTNRSISDKKLSLRQLSNLLWAACGVNRKNGPFGSMGRTNASASNSQEVDLYVAMADGTYLYERVDHRLIHVTSEDLRPFAIGHGQRESGMNAPVRLIYVVDLENFKSAGFQEPGLYDPDIQKSYYFVDTGLIAGNVYLFASSEGLATWFHNCNKSVLAKKLNLRPTQLALFGQTVGYAEKAGISKGK